MVGRPVPDNGQEPSGKLFRIDVFPVLVQSQESVGGDFLSDFAATDTMHRESYDQVPILLVSDFESLHTDTAEPAKTEQMLLRKLPKLVRSSYPLRV